MFKRITSLFWCVSLLLGILCPTQAQGYFADKPFLHPLFADNMVMQREMLCPVWGWTTPGAQVTVDMAGLTANAVADADGKWLAKIGPFNVGGPYTLTVSGPQTVTRNNVLVGDVWICSGQSNMEMGMKGITQWWDELPSANLPQVRLFITPANSQSTPARSVPGVWRISTADTVGSDTPIWGGFSAIAFLFGRQIHQETKIPIGLIEACWGATDIEAWSSPASLRAVPEFKNVDLGTAYEKAITESWQRLDPAFSETKGWSAADFDAQAWKSITLPKNWLSTALPNFSGVVWFRKELDVPQSWVGKDLLVRLGTIDSQDTVWVNGGFVGADNDYRTPREYLVPGSLIKTTHVVLAVRVLGRGGFTGKPDQMQLVLSDRSQDAMSLTGPWAYHESTPSSQTKGQQYERRYAPTGCFHGMIMPMAPMAIKGFLWYQGEGNVGRNRYHRMELANLITDWRTLFGVKDAPFYLVQLSSFGPVNDTPTDSGWARVREAELQVTQTVPHTGMAVSIDRGAIYNIHPPDKQDPAKRLAMVALAQTYGRKVEFSGPIYRGMKVEGTAIRLTFDYVGGGLLSRGGAPTGFAIAGEDKRFVWANAIIEGETIVVSSPLVAKPISVRYGWADNASYCNVYNKAGFPASPFRTDTD